MKLSLVPGNKSSPGSQGCGFPICSAVPLLRYQADANAHIHLFTFLYCTTLEITYLRVKKGVGNSNIQTRILILVVLSVKYCSCFHNVCSCLQRWKLQHRVFCSISQCIVLTCSGIFFFLEACMIWEIDCVCTHSCICPFLPALLLSLITH